MTTNTKPDRYLAIYLNDHLAGAAGGLALACRLRDSNAGDPEMGEPLARICADWGLTTGSSADATLGRSMVRAVEVVLSSRKNAPFSE